MRKLKFTIWLFILMAFGWTANAQTIQIGSGSSTGLVLPLSTNWGYNYSQTIYTAAQILGEGASNNGGTITTIRYKPTTSNSTVDWRDWTVYMCLTDKTEFTSTTDWVEIADLTEVFNGQIASNTVANQWMEITLTTPFMWDGISNIVVAIDENTPDYGNSTYWATFTSGTNTGMYYRSDSNNPDPDNPPSASSRTAIIPQIQFDGDLMEPCSGAPFAGIITDAMEVCGGSEISVTANGATSGFSGLIYQWQNREGSTGDWTNVDGANATTLNMFAPNVDTEYRFSVTCNGNTDYSNSLLVTIKPAADCFCTPGGTSTYHIADFSTTGGIENISNLASGNSAGGYGDFSDKVVSQELGESVSFTAVTNGTITAGFRVWVDWNQNGTFEESEIMFSSSSYINTHSGTFTVPMDALEGETKMRVVNHYLNMYGEIDPCATNHTYGEFEDYTFDVIHPSCYRPADLTANNITPYTAELSWTQIGTVGEWEIEWGIGNDLVLGMGTNEIVTSSTHLLQNLNSDTDYSYYVRAICGVGDESNWTGPYSFRTQVSCPQPIDLEVTNITPFTADLSWVEDGTATEWEIEWGEGSFVQGMGTNVDVSATTYQLQGLTSDTDHRFYVRAKCGVGDESVWSGPSDFRTEISCFAPVDVNVSDLTTTTAKINWTEPDQLPDGYELYISELNIAPSAFDIADYTATAGTTSIDLSGLSDNTQYYYWIRSSCTANDYSSFVSGSFKTPCVPFALPFFEGFESGYTDAATISGCVNQEIVTGVGFVANSSLTTYNRTPRTGSFNATLRYGSQSWMYFPVELEAGETYRLKFYARQDGTGTSNASVKASFGAVNEASAMTNEIVAQTGLVNGDYQEMEGYFNVPATGVYFIGINGTINSSPWYISLDDISLDLAPDCLEPGNITVSNITNVGATVNWVASVDDPSGGYEIYYSTSSVDPLETTTANATVGAGITTADISGLTGETTYHVWVRANCGTSFSVWEGPATFTSACDPISVPYFEGFESGYADATLVGGCISQEVIAKEGFKINSSQTNYERTPRTGSFNATLVYSAESWMFIPMALEEGKVYQMKFYARQNTDVTANATIGASYGVNANSAAMTNPIIEQTGLVSGDYQELMGNFMVPSTGTYFVGIHGYVSGSPWYISLDDISIEEVEILGCVEPLSVGVSSITNVSATVSWGGLADVGYDIYVGSASETPDENTVPTASVGADVFSYDITGLTTNTTYKVWIRSNCAGGEQSDWEGTTFTTIILMPIPYLEEFNTTATPTGYALNAGAGAWVIGTPAAVPGNPMYNIYKNLWSYGQTASFSTCNIGLVEAGNVLTFDHKTANYSSPYAAPGEGTGNIVVEVSANGGDYVQLGQIGNSNDNSYQFAEYSLDAYVGQIVKFRFTGNWNSGDYYVAIDNIYVGKPITCFKPNNLALENVTENSAKITWEISDVAESANYDVYFSTDNTEPTESTLPTATVSNLYYDITGLTPNTKYYAWVRGNCGVDDVSMWTEAIVFTTAQIPATLPFFEGFEGDIEWAFVDEGQANPWVVGTAYPYEGDKSVYVSSDGGVTNDYANTTSTTMIYRDIDFPDGGKASVSFNWKSGGESLTSDWDYMRVYLMPTTVMLTPGTEPNASYRIGATSYKLQEEWQDAEIELPYSVLGSVQRLVFSWKNDGSTQTEPGGAIVDNIVVEQESCATPYNLSATSTTSSITFAWTSASTDTDWEVQYIRDDYDLDWTSVQVTQNPYTIEGLVDAATYRLRVRTVCAVDEQSDWSEEYVINTECLPVGVPYVQDFQSAEVPNLPTCTSIEKIGDGNDWKTASRTSYGFSGKVLSYTYNTYNAANAWFYTQGIELEAGVNYMIAFKYATSSTYSVEKLKVSYGENAQHTYMTNELADLPSITNIDAENSNTIFTPAADGIYYFGFNCYSDANKYTLYVGDIVIKEASSEKEIVSVTIPGQENVAIDDVTNSVVVTMPFGTEVEALTPTIEVSEFATINPESDVEQDFTNPVEYVVTAEDGSTADWTISVVVTPASTEANIVSFVLAEQTGDAVIDNANHTVSIEVEFGTDASALIPTIVVSDNATIDPVSGDAQDFTVPVVYTVTAEDVTVTQEWTVNVSVAAPTAETDILTFTLAEQTGPAVIDDVAQTVTIEVVAATDFTNLVPTITVSEGATINPESGVAQDFTNPVTYTVTAQDGITEGVWTVTVTEAPYTIVAWTFPNSPDDAIADEGVAVNLDREIVAVGTNAPTFNNAGVTTNSANATGWNEGENTKYWMVDFSTKGFKDITLQSAQRASAVGPRDFKIQYRFDETEDWVDVPGADITVDNNFTSGKYPETAMPADWTSKDQVYVRWVMTSNTSVNNSTVGASGTSRIDDIIVKGVPVHTEAEIIAFTPTGVTLAEQVVIDSENATVTMTAIMGEDVTAVEPVIEISEAATINPASGVAQDFTNPVPYTVTAEDGTEKVWTVTINVLENPVYEVVLNTSVGGAVSGAGMYEEGSDVVITATVEDGYLFANWTDATDNVVSTDNPYEFVMPGYNVEYTANYNKLYNLITDNNPATAGTTEGDGEFIAGVEVQVTATANEGYEFENWTIGETVVSTDNPFTYTTTEEDVTIVANYSAIDYNVTVTILPENSGTVTGDGAYNIGEDVTLTAEAAEGYEFVSWSIDGGDAITDNPYEFEMPAAHVEVVANFQAIEYELTLSANPVTAGSVNGAGAYVAGAVVEVSAVANDGFNFVNWTKDGEEVSDEATFNYTMPMENAALVANFEADEFVVSVVINPEEGGTVSGAGAYSYVSLVTLEATPAEGYEFVSWEVDGEVESTETTYMFVMPAENVTVTANFAMIDYTVTLNVDPAQGGEVEGDGTYNLGDEVTVIATPAEGYLFVNWTDAEGEVSENETYTFTMPSSNVVLTANFEEIIIPKFTLSLEISPANAGTVSGGGEYEEGEDVTVSTTAVNENFVFLGWTNGTDTISNDAQFVFTMIDEDVTLVAHYRDHTSISENDMSGIQIYPNPSLGIFNVVVDKAYDMEIVDMTGRRVSYQNVIEGTNAVDIQHVQTGIYFVRLISNDDIKVIRIVKN